MRVDVHVPQIGEAVSELLLAEWFKAEGDAVETGEPIFSVDSDKAVVEVEATYSGTLVSITADEGASVMPNEIVAVIETAEVSVDPTDDVGDAMTTASDGATQSESGTVSGSEPVSSAGKQTARSDIHGSNFAASPKAKRLAQEYGVDLTRAGISGTGIRGMITGSDVLEVGGRGEKHQAGAEEGERGQDGARRNTGTAAARGRIAGIIAKRTQESKQTVPHFYMSRMVTMTKAVELRDYFRRTKPDEKPPTITDIIVRAAALAVLDLPWANVVSSSGGPEMRQGIDIGVVVKTDAGLSIPVVRSADQKPLPDVSAELRRLAAKAREGRLSPDETGSKTMTISNAGMYGVDIMYPIIDMPDALICGVGALRENAVPTTSGIQAVPQLMLSLSVDHRVFDGADAGRILEAMALRIEQPFEIVGVA